MHPTLHLQPGSPLRQGGYAEGARARWPGCSTVLSLLLPLALANASAVTAQASGDASPETGRLLVPRLETPIVLDGDPYKAAWNELAPLFGVMMIPDFMAPPSERTEFRLAHDGESLYFSCRAYDSEPGAIQIASMRRDEIGWGSDRCGVFLDTLNDGDNSLGFITNPAGALSDIAYSNNGRTPFIEWNTYWDVAVSITEDGWHAEFRIPFSSFLIQPDQDGKVEMGVSMLRAIARRDERITHPAMPPDWGEYSHRRSSQMRKIVLEGVARSEPLYVTPYALAGGGYHHSLNAARTEYQRHGDRVGELGLDVRYGLTPNLTLDVTLNPDFAQVEADDQQVNLTRVSLFFPEKRRFFQQRASVFDYSLGTGNERLFHSRQIGLEQGMPVRIFGGARLVGRVGDWDVGMLSMQMAPNDLRGGENQTVARLRRRVLNANSYAGGMVTSRLGTDGRRNVAYGVDGVLRLFDEDLLHFAWAESLTAGGAVEGGAPGRAGPPAPMADRSPLDQGFFRLNLERPGEDGLSYALGFSRSGDRFDPGMGFLQRRDITSARFNLGHGWRPGESSRFRTYSVGIDGVAFLSNADRSAETVEVAPRASLRTRSASTVTLALPFRYEQLNADFRLPRGSTIPAGRYRFNAMRLSYRAPQGSLVQPNTSLEAGHFFDGRQVSLSVRPTWSFSRHLSLGTAYVLDHVTFPQRGQRFTNHIGQLRTELMLSKAASGLAFIQFNSAQSAVIANLRLHYKPREGNELYIVWNERLVDGHQTADPVRPERDERAILLKYSHTFRLGL